MYPDQARGSNCAFLGFIIFPTSLDFNNIPRTIIMEARQWTVTCGGQGGGQSPVLWGDSGISDTGWGDTQRPVLQGNSGISDMG